ncbi:MAG: AAA family ATPase, partial [bacterium]|nr:AAA family ATPase [bacterium]
PATLRRFVFKVTLDYLAPGQAETAFRSHFDLPPPPSLATLAALTPGDFAVVRNKAEILGVPQDPEALAEMLHAECAARPDRPRAIGFRLGGSVER